MLSALSRRFPGDSFIAEERAALLAARPRALAAAGAAARLEPDALCAAVDLGGSGLERV